MASLVSSSGASSRTLLGLSSRASSNFSSSGRAKNRAPLNIAFGILLVSSWEVLMGYDLYITRAAFWAENDNDSISPEEWLAIVADDPELTLNGDENTPYFARWSGKSVHSEPWLDWFHGNIYSKNPDQPIIQKMVEIANRLQAQVQGEEGEVYDGSEEGFTI